MDGWISVCIYGWQLLGDYKVTGWTKYDMLWLGVGVWHDWIVWNASQRLKAKWVSVKVSGVGVI